MEAAEKEALYQRALKLINDAKGKKPVIYQSQHTKDFQDGWNEGCAEMLTKYPIVKKELQELYAKHCGVDLVAVQCANCVGAGYLRSNFFPVGNLIGQCKMNLVYVCTCRDCIGMGLMVDFLPSFKLFIEKQTATESGESK